MEPTANKLAILAARQGVTVNDLVNAALERNNQSISAAARDLQVSRQTIWSFVNRRTHIKVAER